MKASRDTSASAREAQLAVFRRLDPAVRLALAFQMSDEALAIAEAGMRHRHPHWSTERIRSGTRDVLLGEKLARELSSRRPLQRL